ncbi:hypothetical protein EYR38_005051 [Pleurotus pulmonarius]|nr:hypothetical protein EYR38_005051 [Pleurotus pulmonarius]
MTTFTESFQPETGCLSLALFLTAILYGVSLLLIGLYFLSPARPNDSVFVKCTVAFLSILGTAEMLCLFVGIEIKMLNPSTPNQVFALPLGEMVFMVVSFKLKLALRWTDYPTCLYTVRTDVVVAKLMRYSIHRGAATSVAAVLTVLFVTIMPSTALMVPLLVSGQLYVISVVSMLLNRSKLRDLLHGLSSTTISSHSAA